MAPQYCGNQLFTKLSLLRFYHRIFYISETCIAIIWTLAGVQTAWFIATYLVHYFDCTPVSKYWNTREPGYCIDGNLFLIIGETLNSAVDFIMIIVALWMVGPLRLDRAAKLWLFFLFVVGGL